MTQATRTFVYAYDSVGNRNWTKRDAGTGDVFGYDYNDQVTAVKLNIANPDTTAVGLPTIGYDANGNRTSFAAYGPTDNYVTNNLNQYSSRNSSQATYHTNGNMITGVDGSTYTYDAQNRLLSATKSGVTETFKYDGLNRQVSRTVAGVTTYNVYDGWNLIEEYQTGGTVTAAYLHGAGGLVKNLVTNNYYYQDASGSSSHLTDNTGHLLEWYRYDLQGTPVFYTSWNTQLSTSNYSVRHLFTGQQWYSELGLYDLRNRFYSPDIGRFLQADPSGFNGDATNLYRYCGNNPLKRSDPMGLGFQVLRKGAEAYSPAGAGGSGVTDGISGTPVYSTDGLQIPGTGNVTPTVKSQGFHPQYTDGNVYQYTDSNGDSGVFQTVGAQSIPTADEGYDTAGWDTSEQSAVVAGYGSWSFSDGKEWAGVTFQNPDGSWGYTIAWSDANTATRSWVGPTVINGVAATDIWHVHVANVPDTLYFSSNDVYNATRINGNIYMANLDGYIRVHGPDSTAVPNSRITYWGVRVAGPGFGPFGSW